MALQILNSVVITLVLGFVAMLLATAWL